MPRFFDDMFGSQEDFDECDLDPRRDFFRPSYPRAPAARSKPSDFRDLDADELLNDTMANAAKPPEAFAHVGKQMFGPGGKHIADAVDVETAQQLCVALNFWLGGPNQVALDTALEEYAEAKAEYREYACEANDGRLNKATAALMKAIGR